MGKHFMGLKTVLFSLMLIPILANTAAAAPQYTLAQAEALWQKHLTQTLGTARIQKGCEPFFKKAQTAARRGTVLLFHGYTACPQQYEGLSEALAQKGYNVYVPLLPGHGRPFLNAHPNTRSGKGDDISLMPGQYELARYYAFSEHMSQLLMPEPRERIVGGLSLGASLAVHSLHRFPDLAQRGFLISPLFDIATPGRYLVPLLAPLLPYQRISWGESCEDERRRGRAGYCEFNLTHVSAVQKLGKAMSAKLSEVKQPVQIVGTEQDSAASNPAIAEAHHRLPQSHACFFQEGVSHSMLSPQDNPTRDMFWLPALTSQLLRFVTTGQAFDTGKPSEQGLSQCKI